MAKSVKHGEGTMKVSCMVLLCSLFIISLSSVAFAQSGCLARQFDPQGGFKCNDIATGASQFSPKFNQNDSNDEKSDVQRSSETSNYFNYRNYFDNRAYFEYNPKIKNNRSDIYYRKQESGANKFLGNDQLDTGSQRTR